MRFYRPVISAFAICALVALFSQCKNDKDTAKPTVVNIDTSNNIIAVANIDSTSFALPTAFTPNGDGRNDYYYAVASNPGRISAFSLSVYESTGKLVFQTDSLNFNGKWDGYVNGVLDTNYRYEVHVSFTTVSGKTFNANSFLFSLSTSTAQGCPIARQQADINSYVFPDQIDAATGSHPYVTGDVLCL